MSGPSGLCVTYADIRRMLLESADDSGSTGLSISRGSDVNYAERKLELS